MNNTWSTQMTITTTLGQRRDADAIQDDMNDLISLKLEFIALMERMAAKSTSDDMPSDFVGAEECVNEMLHSAWESLNEENRTYDDLPQSQHMKKWRKDSSTRSATINAGVPA
jgi:hypothetical protein